ncbi:MAG: hypothetical protein COV52_01105 [Gammaproteobacteria bacterium CG11_big_fil_rev_8_21_14_0_20_46_22]|nr:MAG: hypothetical protein COW05_03395 [Gammaproteobacteria bacterium CG12_big_fil_rev_8_21_14_0_65_46_12]PIR12016.1 MAG: hypothetical protein COV52_01105 [Gammaproteobacteria bacterium CG11_big_fil_rev_8_21_14_0_20_46_22]
MRAFSVVKKLSLAFLAYLFLAFILSAHLWAHPTQQYFGSGKDPLLFIWMLQWSSYAFAHHLNPFFCPFLWWPKGVHLLMTTNVPLLGLLALPLTHMVSAVLSYNILMVLGLAVSASSAFLLNLELSGRAWPSWFGGLLFGFSPFAYVHLANGHLNWVTLFLPPLLLWLLMRDYRGLIGRVAAVISGVFIVTLAFLVSKELVVLSFIVLFFLGLFSPLFLENRVAYWKTVVTTAWITFFSALVLSPFVLSYVFFKMYYFHAPVSFSLDLANLLIPTTMTALGHGFMPAIHQMFTSVISENAGYMGLPLLVLALLALIESPTRQNKLAWVMLIVCVFLAFGPRLHIFGLRITYMPWAIMYKMPFLMYLAPARFMIFAFLALSTLLTAFFSLPSFSFLFRVVMLVLVIMCLWPNPQAIWMTKPKRYPLLLPSAVSQRLDSSDNFLVLDEDSTLLGHMMLWRLQPGQHFKLLNGYLGPGAISSPEGVFFSYPEYPLKVKGASFSRYLKHHHAVILCDSRDLDLFKSLLSTVPYRVVYANHIAWIYLGRVPKLIAGLQNKPNR